VPLDQALTELRRCAGTQFDPHVVEVFCEEAEAVLRDVEAALPQDPIESPADDLAELVLRVPENERATRETDA
jgi:HD-GYP domain-containing protein (c-di-GMP phosphodiesterase class II)